MKRHTVLFKNIAALIMAVALLTLLLPICNITTNSGSTKVSGMELIKITAAAGQEYYSKGTIANDYVLKGTLTWGNLKEGANYVMQHKELQTVVIYVFIALLPILFCLLSMIFTFLAEGKKTIFLPTILIALAFLETSFLIICFFQYYSFIAPYATITLLLGLYGFTALCGLAFLILLLLWITGGFRKPNYKDTSNAQDYKNRKKNRSVRKERRVKKRRKRRRRKKSKRSSKYYEKDSHMVANEERNKEDRTSEDKTNTDVNKTKVYENGDDNAKNSSVYSPKNAAGQVTGLSGVYSDTNVNLLNTDTRSLILGTTPEAIKALLHPSMDSLPIITSNNFIIQYDNLNEEYTITNNSNLPIMLETSAKESESIQLLHGDSRIVSANTMMYIGTMDNSMRLE